MVEQKFGPVNLRYRGSSLFPSSRSLLKPNLILFQRKFLYIETCSMFSYNSVDYSHVPSRGADKTGGIPASGYLVPSHFSQNLACRIKDVTFSQTTQRTTSAIMMDNSTVISRLLDRGRQIIIMPKIGRRMRRACYTN